MHALLLQLAAMLPVQSLPQAGKLEASLRVLERSSVAVTDISGGFAGPRFFRPLLAASYDRVEHGFRSVRRKQGPNGEDEVWVAELEPDQFRALLDLAVATGVANLPLESPPSCMDVYGRGRQILLDYGPVMWANGSQGGCVVQDSEVVPTRDDRRQFDEAVAWLERAFDALPMRRGEGWELYCDPFVEDVRALKTRRLVMQHVLYDPMRHDLDLERAEFSEWSAAFPWRGRYSGPVPRCPNYVVDLSRDVQRAASAASTKVFEPVKTGMSTADVLARLGEPDERRLLQDGSCVWIYLILGPIGPPPQFERLYRAPARLRFEDGRLAAP